MSSKDAERRETLIDLLSDCDVGEEHKLLDKVVGLHHLVHLHISCAVSLFLKSYLDLSGSQGQCSLIYPFLLQLLCDFVQVSDSLCDAALILRVHQLLRLSVSESSS